MPDAPIALAAMVALPIIVVTLLDGSGPRTAVLRTLTGVAALIPSGLLLLGSFLGSTLLSFVLDELPAFLAWVAYAVLIVVPIAYGIVYVCATLPGMRQDARMDRSTAW